MGTLLLHHKDENVNFKMKMNSISMVKSSTEDTAIKVNWQSEILSIQHRKKVCI